MGLDTTKTVAVSCCGEWGGGGEGRGAGGRGGREGQLHGPAVPFWTRA